MEENTSNTKKELAEKIAKKGLNKYKVRVYGTIPGGCMAIKRNYFDNKIFKIAKGGFFLNLPIWEVKLVITMEDEEDYKPEKLEDKNGIDLVVDSVLTPYISDPIKYETKHLDVEAKLKNTLYKELRKLFKKYPYEFLSREGFDLPASPGPNYSAINGKIYKDTYIDNKGQWRGTLVPNEEEEVYYEKFENKKACVERFKSSFQHDLLYIRIVFDQFEREYGYAVKNYSCKKIDTSEEVRKKQEEYEMAKQDVLIEEEKKKKKRIVAEGDAEAYSIRLKAIRDSVKGSSPVEQKMMSDYLYTNGANGELSKDSAASVKGAIAGATAAVVNAELNGNNQANKQKTR